MILVVSVAVVIMELWVVRCVVRLLLMLQQSVIVGRLCVIKIILIDVMKMAIGQRLHTRCVLLGGARMVVVWRLHLVVQASIAALIVWGLLVWELVSP